MNPSASLYIIRRLNDIHRVPKNVHLYIFQITLSKLTDFEVFLMWEILRKFDIKSLYIFPPYLYTVTTLPWEIQKVIFQQYYFNSIIYTDFRLLRYPRRNKLQLLYCSLSVYLLLFTASYYLLSPFYGQFFLSHWSVIFKVTNANPQPALFRVTNIWRNATLFAVRCKSLTFYKVVWWIMG